MFELELRRERGSGEGSKIGFPTINSTVTELPDGVTIGLYASCVDCDGKGFTLISKSKEGGFRIETHTINTSYIDDNVGYKLYLFKKIREHKNFRNREKQIVIDKGLCKDFFDNIGTCSNCKYLVVQDYGYSNYTVTDTEYSCLLGVFEGYGYINTVVEYNVSSECNGFSEGDGWHLDVDGEDEKPSEEYIKQIRREYSINNILRDEI